MALFSKFRSQNITPLFRRNVRFPNEGMPTDPRPYLEEFTAEPHAEHVTGVRRFSMWVIIPVLSAIFWYQEYQHLYAHRSRPRFPKQDFLHQGVNLYPFTDSKHTFFHHEYFNFTPYGYETDKEGNRLPPGVYAEE